MKMKLEKGDPCFVRINTGAIVEAVYLEPSPFSKCHRVSVVDYDYTNTTGYHVAVSDEPLSNNCARLVYPVSEMKRQMGLQ